MKCLNITISVEILNHCYDDWWWENEATKSYPCSVPIQNLCSTSHPLTDDPSLSSVSPFSSPSPPSPVGICWPHPPSCPTFCRPPSLSSSIAQPIALTSRSIRKEIIDEGLGDRPDPPWHLPDPYLCPVGLSDLFSLEIQLFLSLPGFPLPKTSSSLPLSNPSRSLLKKKKKNREDYIVSNPDLFSIIFIHTYILFNYSILHFLTNFQRNYICYSIFSIPVTT